jgi:hypothetical protein
VIHGDWIIAQPRAYALRTGDPRMVIDPTTGKPRPWAFTRAYGCGPVAGCRSMLFFRSGTLGFYDFATHGTTTFGGIRPGCSVTMVPACGLMLVPEGSSGCSCSYNFQTSLALLPRAERVDQWYVFHGEQMEAVPRRLRVNLGAPGDRRDAGGSPWHAFPRPDLPGAAPVPLRVVAGAPDYHYAPSAGAAGTLVPWVYTSGARGACTFVVDLERAPVAPASCDSPPKIDGDLTDICWRSCTPVPFEADAHLQNPRATLYICRDAKNLNFAFHREAAVRDGKRMPFRFRKEPLEGDEDENALRYDSVLLRVTDAKRQRSLDFGLSFGGSYARASKPDGRGKLSFKAETSVAKDRDHWSAEVRIPLAGIAAEKLNVTRLQINCTAFNRSGVGPATAALSSAVSPPLGSFVPLVDEPVAPQEATYSVRLHVRAEPGAGPVDVVIQGKPALRGVNAAERAGGAGRGVALDVFGVRAAERLSLGLVPSSEAAGARAPTLCGLEITRTSD